MRGSGSRCSGRGDTRGDVANCERRQRWPARHDTGGQTACNHRLDSFARCSTRICRHLTGLGAILGAAFHIELDVAQTPVVVCRLPEATGGVPDRLRRSARPLNIGRRECGGRFPRAAMKFDPQALKRAPMFAALSDRERYDILSAASLRHLARDERAFSEGAPANDFFLSLSGHVKLSRASWHRGSIILRIVHPGEPFGLARGAQGKQYGASAIALRDCTLAVWPIEIWSGFIKDMPSLATGLIQVIEHRLAVSQDQLVEIATLDVPRRIAHGVLRLIDQVGQQEDNGVKIDFPITRRDIAELTGTTLHSASRVLTQWERLGIIGGGRRTLVVRNVPALVSLATPRVGQPGSPMNG